MRLDILSDLHLELFGFKPDRATVELADVVVLAGDIHKGVNGISWARQTFPGKPVIYVVGNHEFYDHYWLRLNDELREEARRNEVHFLENEAVKVGDLRFLRLHTLDGAKPPYRGVRSIVRGKILCYGKACRGTQ